MVTALSQCATDGRRPEFPAQVAPILGRMALRLAMVALVLTAGCGAPLPGPAAPAAADVAGSWAGRVDRPGAPLELDVTFTGGPGSLAGTLDVPAQRIAARPLVDVAVDGATVRFAAPELDASFAGTLAADASAIGGTFTQTGKGNPLVLHRVSVASPVRPAAAPST